MGRRGPAKIEGGRQADVRAVGECHRGRHQLSAARQESNIKKIKRVVRGSSIRS
jgi:hypothetical protein